MTAPIPLSDQARVLLSTLWRGGAAGYFWTTHGKRSQWTPAGSPAAPELGSEDVYFGVHPLALARGEHERGRIADVAAVSCLFSEFDRKDYGNLASIREHIKALPMQPQVIVASGGGYHGYWCFQEPVDVCNATRDYLIGLQRAWVRLTGGDPGAADLARVLRLPDTLNTKYTPARRVTFARFNLTTEGGELHDVNRLAALAEEHFEPPAAPVSAPATTATPGRMRTRDAIPPRRPGARRPGVIDLYNTQTAIAALLAHYGYTVSDDGRHFTRPGKSPSGGMSGSIDPERNRAYTFSSNDPMFDAGNVSPSGAGCTLTPFDLLARLSFGGDVKAAVKHLATEAAQ